MLELAVSIEACMLLAGGGVLEHPKHPPCIRPCVSSICKVTISPTERFLLGQPYLANFWRVVSDTQRTTSAKGAALELDTGARSLEEGEFLKKEVSWSASSRHQIRKCVGVSNTTIFHKVRHPGVSYWDKLRSGPVQ